MNVRRVLIANLVLSGRTGTEMFVRDLAVGLLGRGDRPMVWSPSTGGGVSTDLQEAGVPVFDRLDQPIAEPDVIHGHHHDETLAALARFPDRPGVFVLHDAAAWHSEPPRHPRLLRYLAVDDLCRERLVAAGVVDENIGMLRNTVDLDRFRQRGALPERPRRALIFSHTARADTHLPLVREACARLGLELDVVGRDSGNELARPETALGEYDVVFAKGRAALEALAVGCAVVVLDWLGMGGLVTRERVPEWRRWNFGRHLLRTPLSVDALSAELARYDATDAADCCAFVRSTCSLDSMLDAVTVEYDAVLKRWADAPPPDPRAELVDAAGRFAALGRIRSAELDARLRADASDASLREANASLRDADHRLRLADAAVRGANDRLDATKASLDEARDRVLATEAALLDADHRVRASEAARDEAEHALDALRSTRVMQLRDRLLRSRAGPVLRRLVRFRL